MLEHHGWEDVGAELHGLSRAGKWTDMAACISDDMLEAWAIVATYDELAARLRERCSGIFTSLLLDLPARLAADEDRVHDLVGALRGA